MNKGDYNEAPFEQEKKWYDEALKQRQMAITKGAYGFDGSGMSSWTTTAEYKERKLQDSAALRLSERRAKQNWMKSHTFRPFWSNGIMG